MPVVKLEEPALAEVPKVKEESNQLPLTYLPLSSFDPCTTLTPKRQRKLREANNQNSQELLMQFLMATAPLSPGLVTNPVLFCSCLHSSLKTSKPGALDNVLLLYFGFDAYIR